MTTLTRLAAFGLLMTFVHIGDHALNQPSRDLGTAGNGIGVIAVIISAATLWLAMRRSFLAPLAALGTGIATTAGLSAIHIAPRWSSVSDPYSAVDVNALSWLIVGIAIAGAIALTAVGARETATRRRPSPV